MLVQTLDVSLIVQDLPLDSHVMGLNLMFVLLSVEITKL